MNSGRQVELRIKPALSWQVFS